MILVAFVAAAGGCGGGVAQVPAGQEKGHCFPNGTCNSGLSCFSNRCVKYGASGPLDGSAEGVGDATGSAGAAGESTAGVAGAGGAGSGGPGSAGSSGTSGGAGSGGKAGTSGAAGGVAGTSGGAGAGGNAGTSGGAGGAGSGAAGATGAGGAGSGAAGATGGGGAGSGAADAGVADAPMEAPPSCPGVDAAATGSDPHPPADGGPGAVFSLSTGAQTACVSSESGQVKCWGANETGELGLGDLANRGDDPNEMGSDLPFVSLGTGLVARTVGASFGTGHVCTLFTDARVKCWGSNQNTQLGLGDGTNRGGMPGQMGDNLPFVDLGTGRKASSISVGSWWTCALLDRGQVKCWGSNRYGELGLGDTNNRGASPSEMGDNLPAVDLGTCRTAKAISAGKWGHTCAVLENGQVKCWGINASGELGLGDTLNRGDQPGQMGDALPAVRLGTGRTAVAVSAGSYHTCALLDDAKVKCWGENEFGQLGLGDTSFRGRYAVEMGDNLPEVDLGTGRTVTALTTGFFSTCAILDNGQVKCWGQFYGLGESPSQRGSGQGTMGDALPAIDLGTGRTAKALSISAFGACALLDDGRVKCWGTNESGQLGQGDTAKRGDAPGEMGDALPAVPLW